jgi:cytochrome c-type biogenesis protein
MRLNFGSPHVAGTESGVPPSSLMTAVRLMRQGRPRAGRFAMGSEQLTIGGVFLAGVLSFLSPCVLPLMPAYLSLISGLTFEQLQDESAVRQARGRLFGSAIAFLLGFSLVTVVLLGGLVSAFSQFGQGREIMRYVGGGVVIIFALHLIGVFRIRALFNEQRFHVQPKAAGVLGAALVGAAFAFGWSPCLGPILGTVLAVSAATAKTSWLAIYTLGLAVPFLLAALFVDYFLRVLRKITRHLRVVEILSGVLLLTMGILLLTDQMHKLSGPSL